jgi:hypothetical protein
MPAGEMQLARNPRFSIRHGAAGAVGNEVMSDGDGNG